MSLVAYEASDESENDEEEETALSVSSNSSQKTSMFATLPLPKSNIISVFESEVEISADILGNKSNFNPTSKTKKQPVKIYLEPLSEFTDAEVTKKKKRVSSSAGSGLFSVLPPPQNKSGKVTNRLLVPHTLTKRQEKREIKSVVKNRDETNLNDETDNEVSGDFFGLQTSAKLVLPEPKFEISLKEVNEKLPMPVLNPTVYKDAPGPSLEMEVEPEDQTAANVSKANRIEDLFQDQAFMRVRGKKRNLEEETDIIDVSQTDQMLSWEDRAKLLTQEDENAPVNAGPQPSAQHRRKHQITYLAYQAKARELELKNQWAQNRFTKNQTRAKYGF